MIEVAIEVRSGTARTAVAVTAESMERALRLVSGRFPTSTCTVKFPTASESSFAPGVAHQAAA